MRWRRSGVIQPQQQGLGLRIIAGLLLLLMMLYVLLLCQGRLGVRRLVAPQALCSGSGWAGGAAAMSTARVGR
jgi:hypothetical protein